MPVQNQKKKPIQLHPSFRKTRDQLLILMPLCALSVWLYGFRPLIMFAIASLLAVISDAAVAAVRKRHFDVTDLSSLCFAIMLTLMLPATCSYTVVAFGTLFTVLLGKHAFGGWGVSPFHPAAYGFAATAICFPTTLFLYPQPFTKIGIAFHPAVELYEGPAATLKLGGKPDIELVDLLLGNFVGPMGATFGLIIVASFIFMIAHGEISWHVPVCFVGTCALIAFLFPRIVSGRLESVLYELCAGTLLFSAVHIAGDPGTAPSTPRARMVYGVILGAMTMLFSHYGVFQQGACFAVLLVSPLSSWLSRRFPAKGRTTKKEEEALTNAQ